MSDHQQSPVETAWHIHDSLRDWTGKVDSKASFALTIESGVLVAVLALAAGDHRLAALAGVAEAFFIAGIAAVVLATLCSVGAVRPQIKERAVEGQWNENFIFFGHLKFWKDDELERALQERDVLPMLARQLIVMSEIAWKKHRLLKWSLTLLVLGCAFLGTAAALK